ncbi:hypothetical protein FBD94_22710 [Pedobacter hiemivivus]|uniref:Uncharacterized protein n=1 Tax=Pedobacter hiemivivus TaxID=2530454 RepID=A0A4U1G6R9_9SPHI|nr:hypothetical protein [Pedobacter hiemivivus]TCC96618.1 hypothetical protein EZ444_11650 [Pedobacter hiemivivus]TKC56532.1 hypothetical protein FBD94_22710 [Pedobacter hiemivivus]
MEENKSPHILNTSATLLGLCFIVLTSIKVSKMQDSTLIDETTALAIILFMTSSILSFLSMRKKRDLNNKLERSADFIFLFGLLVLFLTTMMVTFNIVK